MTYTLTENELKVASCGKLDYSKFTDPTKGYANVDDLNSYEFFSFCAQIDIATPSLPALPVLPIR